MSTSPSGRTPSLTQPSPEAQEQLIRQVYKKANLSFDATRYVEAHGKRLHNLESLELTHTRNRDTCW